MIKKLFLVLALLAASLPSSAQVVPAGGITLTAAGQPVSGCTAYSLVYIDSAGNLQCAQAPQNGSTTTAGTSTIKWLSTISGTSATSNFLNITGTFPSTLSATNSAVYIGMTADNDAQYQNGVKAIMSGTGGTAPIVGLWGQSGNAGSWSVGTWGEASGTATNNVAVIGANSASAGLRVGGYFALSNSFSVGTSAALIADNSSVAANIFEARDNGTPVFTIADGGTTTWLSSTTVNLPVAVNMLTNASNLNLGSSLSSIGGLSFRTANTPDVGYIYTGTTPNSLHFAEGGDLNFDFNNGRCGTSACTDPSFILHSHNQATTEYLQLSNDGTLAHLDGQATSTGQGQFAFAGGKTLTESAATVVVDIPVASGAYTGATINWTVVASDGTDHQSRRGSTYLAVVNKAGTETCSVGDVGTTVVAVSTGTLTVTTGQDTTGANVCTFTINAVSSLTQTTLRAHYSVIMDGPGIPTAR